ncbi:MAG: hypothetical protein SFY66_05265 [Oculatellaceae cyanobacterium bins.114]|nr:hypothetical protein [Oculatellaceae cyanobacterium bins.114]
MKTQQRVVWIELVYVGLFLSLGLHWLIWSGKVGGFFERPLYRLQWGWEFAEPILWLAILLLTFRLSWWVLHLLPYLQMHRLVKLPIYIFLIPATRLLILVFLGILGIYWIGSPQTKVIRPEFASPSGKFAVVEVSTSDTCSYRIYSNHFIIQQYVTEFSPRYGGACPSDATIQWELDQQLIRWRANDYPPLDLEIPDGF